jgi:predicted O-methyltransferase YrrM
LRSSRFLAVVRNAFRHGYAVEMLRKVGLRFTSKVRRERRSDSLEWASLQASGNDLATYAATLDAALWNEAERFDVEFRNRSAKRLSECPHDLGGGGDHRLLYFLVRYLRPQSVVETGVAAGFSSAAILEALESNGSGTLRSSDFPYFRIPEPEQYIGWVVPDRLRHSWDLRTKGDRVNLPAIAREIDRVDLLHYDSDKSLEGRRFAINILNPLFHSQTVIVIDDVQDNFWFRDWAQEQEATARVFHFEGKYVGLVGL